jgi:hypothetical protein
MLCLLAIWFLVAMSSIAWLARIGRQCSKLVCALRSGAPLKRKAASDDRLRRLTSIGPGGVRLIKGGFGERQCAPFAAAAQAEKRKAMKRLITELIAPRPK